MENKNRLSRRQFVSTAAAAAGAALLPETVFPAHGPGPAQDPIVGAAGIPGNPDTRERVLWRVEPFPMNQVKLLGSPFKDAMEVNRQWLHGLPNDRLLHTFRLNVGLPSSAEALGGWEKPDCELRGHFAGGHYLSACALTYASTGDGSIKEKGSQLVAELAKCQEKHGNGYLSAYPEDFYTRLYDGKRIWAPFYTYHKIVAGMMDMYAYCGDQQALAVAEKMADWTGHWSQAISYDHMQQILQIEHGGMNEALYNLYAITGKERYLEFGDRFRHAAVFDPLAEHRDQLKGLHANTNIPKMTGCARRYEVTGDPYFHDVAESFWQTVTGERSYCTGGTSNEEHWRTDPGKLASELGQNTEECCCGYNMLKLARHIFGWTADARVMDYYERTLYNSRLGTQDAKGLKSYFLPLGSGFWKYYNSQWDSFWCCTGTGVEEFAKFNDSIYFHDGRGIYVNLFVPSEVDWRQKGVRLRQETRFPESDTTTLTIHSQQPVDLAVSVRVPYWARRGGTLKLNGSIVPVFSSPSSYLTVSRVWRDGDRLEVSFPMSLHVETIPDDPSLQAVMYGPLVLAGKAGDQGLTEANTYIGYDTTPGGEGLRVTGHQGDCQGRGSAGMGRTCR